MSPRFQLSSSDVPPSSPITDANANVSRQEYEKLKSAKEATESQLRMLKLEKEQVDIQRKSDFVENNKRIQQDFEERLEKELKEKKEMEERESKIKTELEEKKKRIEELETQLSEVEMFGKNAVETFGKDASKHKETIAKLEEELKELKEKVAEKEATAEELAEEKKKSTLLEAENSGLKEKIDSMQRSHGEAVYTHLQEVRSLRSSLEKASGEVDKSKSLMVQLDAKEKQHQHEMMMKEREWKNKYDMLEAQLASSKNGGSSIASSSKGPTFDQWREERSKLESELRSLTEASWSAQNAEYAIKAELSRKEADWREERTKLEAEMKHLRDIVKESGSEGYSITSSLLRPNNSFGGDQNDMKTHQHGMTIADLESELQQERLSKKALQSEIATLQYKVTRLESELEERGESGVEVLYGRRKFGMSVSGSGSMDQSTDYVYRQLNEAREKIIRLEEREEALQTKLDEALSNKYKLGFSRDEMKEKDREHREEVTKLEAKVRQLEKKERLLESEVADLNALKGGAFSSEHERSHYQQLRSLKNQLADLQEREDGYLKEIRELKKQISELESNDHGLDAKLWEAQRSQQWALQEKDDEYTTKIRDIKKEYENTIIDNQNKHLKELRDVKRELHIAFREKEDSYMQQLRDAKRREQALQDREDDLVKQIADGHMKSSLNELDIDGILTKKDDEFAQLLEESAAEKTAKIAELTTKVEALELELKNADDTGLLKKELAECKKELDKQRRKHKSEMNQLQNTLDLQKSKEARLQSHIKSMESQITGMVSDYEARLEEAYYATCAVKGALK